MVYEIYLLFLQLLEYMSLIELNLHKIFELCKKYRVRDLSVFGSILTEQFNENSDIDLLFNFEPHDPDSLEFDYFRNYWDLVDELEKLFGRSVDLIDEGALRNKYFIANINRTKQRIYG